MSAKNESKIPASALHEAFDYNAETGVLTWKLRTGTDGKEAGTILPNGYRQVRIKGALVMAHRAAWALWYGEWPDGFIDHINHIRDDNRIVNLRDVSSSGNRRNSSLFSTNTSGVTGVCRNKSNKRWHAFTNATDGGYRHIGSSKNFDEAVKMRKDFEAKNGFHENHGTPRVKDYWMYTDGPYSEYRKEKEMEHVDAYLRSVGLL